jgi:hypothetical protein
MASLLESIAGNLAGDALNQVGRQLGTDPKTAQKAVQAALPVLLSALAKNASNPNGAQSLASALARDHDGSILNNLTSALGNTQQLSDGAKILGHVLGGRQSTVEAGLGKTTGLGAPGAATLLKMLAPVVLGSLGKTQRTQGLDAAGLAALLGGERSSLGAAASGAGLGSLMQLLDADGDGSIVDDVGGLLGKFLGKKPK